MSNCLLLPGWLVAGMGLFIAQVSIYFIKRECIKSNLHHGEGNLVVIFVAGYALISGCAMSGFGIMQYAYLLDYIPCITAYLLDYIPCITLVP